MKPAPKKRGRKPKSQQNTDATPKKRGRKPKVETSNDKKKRGRKAKSYGVTKSKTPPKNDNIILHLPITTKDSTQDFGEQELLKYKPEIMEPQPYEPHTPHVSLAYQLNDTEEKKTDSEKVEDDTKAEEEKPEIHENLETSTDITEEVSDGSGVIGLIQDRMRIAEDGRQTHEERWLKAYKNFRGVYDSTTQYTSTEKSKVFIKITKMKKTMKKISILNL